MKRPRRPAPRKAVKRTKKPVPRPTLDSPKPRKGFAYQWAPFPQDQTDTETVATYVAAGWKPVKRCRGFVAKRGKIIFNRCILMEIPLARQRELVDADIKRARNQDEGIRKLFGLDAETRRIYGGRAGTQLVSQDFMVSSAYETVPSDADPVDVPVVVMLRLSRRFQDAAAALKLSNEQYAQRRMALYVRGELAGILLPVTLNDATALELHESGNFTLIPRI